MAYFGGEKAGRPWPKHNILLIGMNTVFALGFLIFAYMLLSSPSTSSTPKEEPKAQIAPVVKPVVPTAKILVPRKNIAAGVALEPNMFKFEERPILGVEDQVITSFRGIQDQHAGSGLVAGVPVMQKDLAGIENGSTTITRKIPKGHRAVSIPVNEESGVEGWVLPGSRVDVVWSTEHRSRPIVSILVENVTVLSAGRSLNTSNGEEIQSKPVPSYVTLLVTNKDAQKIQLAKNSRGKITLSLRGDDDNEEYGSEVTSVKGLLKARDLEAIEEEQGRLRVGSTYFALKSGRLEKLEGTSTKEVKLVRDKQFNAYRQKYARNKGQK